LSGPPDITHALERAGLVDVAYAVEDSPVGELLLAATTAGLVCVHYLCAEDDLDASLELISRRLSPRVLRAPRRLEQPRRELDEFFTGHRREFAMPLDLALVRPGFTRRVLEQTARIPFGETVSYREIAARAGNDRAYRAAGSALGSNPLPIVVPCHRVLHSGGGLGGYTGGLAIKRRLLTIEGVLGCGQTA
jgi:methylated-DNA-[protein]-cysteine S-methyltransferase